MMINVFLECTAHTCGETVHTEATKQTYAFKFTTKHRLPFVGLLPMLNEAYWQNLPETKDLPEYPDIPGATSEPEMT